MAEITYISPGHGWLYLAVVMDLYSRRTVGWSMSGWVSRHLVVDALRMAVAARRTDGALIHHSDRGGQCTSDDFRDELAKHGVRCSMSGSASCYDNAVVESFFGLLERERVNRVRYRIRDPTRADLFEYIEVFNYRRRRHGYLGNLSPADFEEDSAGFSGNVHQNGARPHERTLMPTARKSRSWPKAIGAVYLTFPVSLTCPAASCGCTHSAHD